MNNKEIAWLMKYASIELQQLIEFKNKVLERCIKPDDLDPPDYHDYQTCMELDMAADKIEGK